MSSQAQDNRIRTLEEWRVAAEEREARRDEELSAFRERLNELAAQRGGGNGKPR